MPLYPPHALWPSHASISPSDLTQRLPVRAGKPIEKGMFCGLLQCLEDGRPFVLMFGAFCGGCQFADVIAEDYRPPDQPMSKMNELVLDTVTALFYILGSYSVYNKDKQFTNPVMRFGLLLILFRIIDYFFISGAFRLPVNEGRYVDQWCQAQLAPGSCEARLENKPGDIHDLSVDPLKTCHFPCRWVCMGDDGQPADCEDEELSATLADGRTIQIKQDHGQCMPFQVDGHDMTIAECVNSGNWYDAVSRAAPEQLPQSELGF